MPIQHSSAETRAWLTLLRAPHLGAAAIRQRMSQHRSAEAVLENVRRDPNIEATTRAWLQSPDIARIDADIEWLRDARHHLITILDDDYPSLLRNAQNPPAALFVAGEATTLWSPQIAIVGSRNATAGGIANARMFVKAFAQAGNVVTSGMAEGIDGAAHAAAIDAGGKTIAVLGTGPDIVYPKRHAPLAERIMENGALVTEFVPGTMGRPEFFPRRNRIIAGLSLGTLVVEASLNSGSLITARLAAEQGREVFALPGPIYNATSRGCHRLIRDGAKLVETAEEVIEELHGVGHLLADDLRRRMVQDDAPRTSSTHTDDPDYAKLLQSLDGSAAAIDELVDRSGLSAAALSSMLLVLELDGVVVAENGRYARR